MDKVKKCEITQLQGNLTKFSLLIDWYHHEKNNLTKLSKILNYLKYNNKKKKKLNINRMLHKICLCCWYIICGWVCFSVVSECAHPKSPPLPLEADASSFQYWANLSFGGTYLPPSRSPCCQRETSSCQWGLLYFGGGMNPSRVFQFNSTATTEAAAAMILLKTRGAVAANPV